MFLGLTVAVVISKSALDGVKIFGVFHVIMETPSLCPMVSWEEPG